MGKPISVTSACNSSLFTGKYSVFNLYGKTLMVYDEKTKKFQLFGKISNIYSLGTYKYLYVFYNKNYKSTRNVFVEKPEKIHYWLSQGLLKIKK